MYAIILMLLCAHYRSRSEKIGDDDDRDDGNDDDDNDDDNMMIITTISANLSLNSILMRWMILG